MSLALLFHYLMLNMFRMLVHPSSGACDLFVELFHGLYCSGRMCTLCTVHSTPYIVHCTLCNVHCERYIVHYALCTVHCARGIRMQPASGYHATPAEPQRNANTHHTRAIQPMQ